MNSVEARSRKASISTGPILNQLPESDYLQRRRQSSAFARKSLRNIDHHHSTWLRRGSEYKFGYDSSRRSYRERKAPLNETSEQEEQT